MSLAPEQQLMQMVMGKFVSRTISFMAKHGVADHMTGPTDVDKIAAAVGMNADALYRAMRALAAVGIFVESEHRTFALAPAGEPLRSDHPRSMRAMCTMLNDHWGWKAWGELDYSVQTGLPAFDHVYGQPALQWFEQHPQDAKAFGDAMSSLTRGVGAAVARAYDFSDVKHLVDVGGSYGILLQAVLERFAHLRGTLFDVPHVVARAKTELANTPHGDRIATVGGSFFDNVPAADAYVLKSILHDWDDASCVKMLSTCRAAMEPGGRVLIVEGLVTAGPESTFTKLIDLQMLVMTQGGRERTEAEYGALLHQAHLALTRIVRTESPMAVIEARAA